MLLAGYRPGSYKLQAIHRPTGAIAGEAKLRLTDQWKDDDRGPSKWFNGILPSYAPLLRGVGVLLELRRISIPFRL